MTGKSYGQEVAEKLVRKAVVWGPPIAGGLLLGPVCSATIILPL